MNLYKYKSYQINMYYTQYTPYSKLTLKYASVTALRAAFLTPVSRSAICLAISLSATGGCAPATDTPCLRICVPSSSRHSALCLAFFVPILQYFVEVNIKIYKGWKLLNAHNSTRFNKNISTEHTFIIHQYVDSCQFLRNQIKKFFILQY